MDDLECLKYRIFVAIQHWQFRRHRRKYGIPDEIVTVSFQCAWDEFSFVQKAFSITFAPVDQSTFDTLRDSYFECDSNIGSECNLVCYAALLRQEYLSIVMNHKSFYAGIY
jgi:hypothetical protein